MKVIFFDGHCGLCNGFVDFMMKVDPKGIFKFSPLQSEFARQNLPAEDIQELKSVVVLIDGQILRKSEGVIAALQELGGVWSLTKTLNVLPSFIRNKGYDLVAANRYKIFGKKDSCRLPTQAERERFIL
jgi:predicted DCC family thiol-disulfide oxidoreductase YuxK